ncbi:MAG: methyltransferase domain-containing protein [Holosporales bacterium]|nr:methyltransferase domain-containing protein [Holosporales bacterium]
MNLNNICWMNYSIDISKGASQSDLGVGVVIVSEHNEIVYSAFTGEEGNASWCSVLLSKARKLQIFNAQSIYITINTWSDARSFDLIALLKEIRINKIYVGLPDPSLTSYLDNDPIITFNHVYRYPDELKRKILEQNDHFFTNSKQSIKYSPYYSENRISDLVIGKLKSKGFIIFKDEINAHKNRSALASLICDKYGIKYSKAINAVNNAISEAFNSKYEGYNYSNDLRSLELDWKENFMSLYRNLSTRPLSTINILNIGVASGHEAISLFSDCRHITFVDIAEDGLKKIKNQIPLSKVIISSASDLSSIPDNSQDLYVSLRTYNSSFFEIREAILEALRVLNLNAIIIISVANGFLCPEQPCIIPGLIVPGTKFVDIYRGMDTAKLIQAEFIQAGFKDIQIFSTNTEIYVSARVTDKGSATIGFGKRV